MPIDLIEDIPSLRRSTDEAAMYVPMFAEWNRKSLPLPNDLIEYVPAPEGWTGASKMGGCVRAVGYHLTGAEAEPLDEQALFATGFGTLIHLAIQAAVTSIDPDRWKAEEKWQMPEHLVQSHADIWDTKDDGETVDIKSAGGFAYKMRYTRGPSIGNVLQATAASMALGAKSTRLVYIATTKLAGRDLTDAGLEKGDRASYGHEWIWDTADAAHLVEKELATLGKVRQRVEAGQLPPRWIPSEMPKGARVETLPDVGDLSGKAGWALRANIGDRKAVMETGKLWQCAYCPYLKTCKEDLAKLEIEVQVSTEEVDAAEDLLKNLDAQEVQVEPTPEVKTLMAELDQAVEDAKETAKQRRAQMDLGTEEERKIGRRTPAVETGNEEE